MTRYLVSCDTFVYIVCCRGYRTEVVEVVKTYQHSDTEDSFEREPFSVLFREKGGGEGGLLEVLV